MLPVIPTTSRAIVNEMWLFTTPATQCSRVNYIIKLLKDKNIFLKDYKKEAIKILLTPNIKNYNMYIDNFYLNMNRTVKKCSNCNKYHTKCD